MTRINWKYAATATVIGLMAIVGGLALGGFARDAYAAILIEIGSAIGLVAILVALERRLETRVTERAETVATAAANRATSDLRDRLVHLENLDQAQSQARADRRRRADSKLDDVHSRELTVERVGGILADAQEQQLFDGGLFRVRTSPEQMAHVLYMLPLRDSEGVQMMWLDFEPLVASGDGIDVGGYPIPIPDRGPSTVLWTPDIDAAELAAQLEEGLARRNEPLHGFKLRYALEQLTLAYRLMRDARTAPADSPHRMQGQLRLLVNDKWAITSFGLESTRTSHAFRARPAGFQGRPGVAVWHHTALRLDPAAAPSGDEHWGAARWWVEEREGWNVEERQPERKEARTRGDRK